MSGDVRTSGLGKLAVIPSWVTSPADAARWATDIIGPRFGRVGLAALGTLDSARAQAVIDACASIKVPLIFGGGAWDIDTPLIPRNHLTVEHEPNCIMTSSQIPGADTAFIWDFEIEHSLAVAGTLFAAVTVGARTFRSTMPFADTAWVWIGQAVTTYLGAAYQIASHTVDDSDDGGAGLSAWTVTDTRTIKTPIYWTLTGNGVDTTVTLYSDAAHTAQLATGALGGIGGGAIVVAATGGSGVSATVTAAANPANDTGAANVLVWTYTVDRTIIWPFLINEEVQLVTTGAMALTAEPLHDFTLIGNGVLMNGTVNRFVRIEGAFRCHVENMTYDGTWNEYGLSYDLGCVDMTANRIVNKGLGGGVRLECCERFWIQASNYHCASGIRAQDSRNGILAECSHSAEGVVNSHGDATTGIELSINTGMTTLGCQGITILGGRSSKCGNGVSMSYATECAVIGHQSEDCDINFSVSPTSLRCTFDSTVSRRATLTTYGLGYYINAPGTKLLGVHSIRDRTACKISGAAAGDIDIVAPDFQGFTALGIKIDTDVTAGSRLNIHGGSINDNVGASAPDLSCIDIAGPMDIHWTDGVMGVGTKGVGGGAFGVYCRAGASGSTLVLTNFKATQANAGNVTFSGQTGHTVLLFGHQQDGTSYPIPANHGNSACNRGTFIANGASEVTVTNAIASAGMKIAVGIQTLGGTPAGAPFQSALTAGTSFGMKAAAGDTSTYAFEVTP